MKGTVSIWEIKQAVLMAVQALCQVRRGPWAIENLRSLWLPALKSYYAVRSRKVDSP